MRLLCCMHRCPCALVLKCGVALLLWWVFCPGRQPCFVCAGKRELPPGIRSRFTELWVAEPSHRADLEALVAAYLLGTSPQPPIAAVVDFYLAAKAAAVCPALLRWLACYCSRLKCACYSCQA